jgi:hypothetical protein
MKVILYTLVLDENNRDREVIPSKHIFDSEDKEDMDQLREYAYEGEEIEEDTLDGFEQACRNFLYETEVVDWGQAMIQCVIINEAQIKLIQQIKL